MSVTFGRSIQRGQNPIRLKGDSKCVSHRRNQVEYLCTDCNQLVCTKCFTTTHESHSFLEINQIGEDQKRKLHDLVYNEVDVQISKLKDEIVTSKKKLLICQPEYRKLSDRIKKQRDQCKIDLDKITEEYLAICHNMMEVSKVLMQTHITNLEERLVTLEKLSSECKKTLQTGTAVLLYDSVSEMQTMYFDIPRAPQEDNVELPKDQDRRSYLEQAMGNMDIHQASTGAIPYKIRDSPIVISEFSYADDVTSICPKSDGRAWLCDCDTDTVKLINNKGQVIQTIQHNSNITHISLDPTTDRLWFCSRDERTICEVSTSFKPVTRFTTDDYPCSLCVTREGRVVVGTEGEHRYKVLIYRVDGRVLHTHIVEGLGTGEVRSITQCGVTGNIAVVSSKLINGDSRNHIIVYNPTLQPLVHVRGEGVQAHGMRIPVREPLTPDKFDPITVVHDNKGNIVIADWTRNIIELLSGAGKHMKTLQTNERQGPVGIQKGNVLWSYLELDTGEWGLKLLKYYSD